jgi:hypothetical protein
VVPITQVANSDPMTQRVGQMHISVPRSFEATRIRGRLSSPAEGLAKRQGHVRFRVKRSFTTSLLYVPVCDFTLGTTLKVTLYYRASCHPACDGPRMRLNYRGCLPPAR